MSPSTALAVGARHLQPDGLPDLEAAAVDHRRAARGVVRPIGCDRGGANAEQVTHAFEILLSDKSVKAVLINIFGGILRVDTLATGVVEAARKTNIQLPIVLRLEGTNVEEGREILKQSGLNFIVAETMKDAAEQVVAAANAA